MEFNDNIVAAGKTIEIKKIYTKYGWRWKIEEETCLICQQEFHSVCQRCVHPIQCVPCIGTCSHIFHLHCVEEWLKNNNKCPMCRCPWEFKKVHSFDLNTGM